MSDQLSIERTRWRDSRSIPQVGNDDDVILPLVPLGNVLMAATGSWTAVFVIAAILNIVAAVMALTVLRPMRLRAMAQG